MRIQSIVGVIQITSALRSLLLQGFCLLRREAEQQAAHHLGGQHAAAATGIQARRQLHHISGYQVLPLQQIGELGEISPEIAAGPGVPVAQGDAAS